MTLSSSFIPTIYPHPRNHLLSANCNLASNLVCDPYRRHQFWSSVHFKWWDIRNRFEKEAGKIVGGGESGRGRGGQGGRRNDDSGGDDNGDDRNHKGYFMGYLCAGGAIASEIVGGTRREYYMKQDGGGYVVEELEKNGKERKIYEEIGSFFLPNGYPRSVGKSYLEFSIWRGLQNVISAMTSVLSTQALLTAIGVNSGEAAGWAAATNWILKDGFGQMGKLFTARMGDQYDTDPKMWRLMSDVVFDSGITLELLTPLFPQYFLLLAAIGNFLKSVSITIGVACRNSVLMTFVKHENLGDITAKNDGQNVVAHILGLGFGIGTARVLPSIPAIRLTAFMILTGMYSVFNYFSMRAVQLTNLNRQRAGLVMDHYVQGFSIPPPSFANRYEKIIPFRKRRFTDPILRFGVSLESLKDEMEILVKQNQKKRFILHMDAHGVHVVLHKNCTTNDLLEAMLGYCHLRRSLQSRLHDGQCKAADTFSEKKLRCVPTIQRVYEEIDGKTRKRLIERSRRYAKQNLRAVVDGLIDAGYNINTLLFAPGKVRAEW